jgi:hypothetical protein
MSNILMFAWAVLLLLILFYCRCKHGKNIYVYCRQNYILKMWLLGKTVMKRSWELGMKRCFKKKENIK